MLPLADLGIPAMVRAAATGFGDKTCVVAPERSLSFRQFAHEVADTVERLDGLGLRAGDRVAILDVNSLPFMLAMCAAGVMGAVVVPLNYRQRVPEHRFQIVDSGARLLLAGSRYTSEAPALAPDLALGWQPIAGAARRPGSVAGDQRWAFADLPGTTPFAICYTSGTTGRPKGAVIDQKCAHMRALKLLLELRLHADDVLHFTTPMFHISCLVMSLMGLMRGATQAVLPQFELEATLSLLRQGQVTFMNTVPTMLSMILDRPGFTPADFGRLRTIMYTAAPISLPLLRRLLEVYRGDLVQFLGQTEDLPQTVLTPEDHRRALAGGDARLGSVGRPCMGVELQIRDGAGCPLPRGSVGEIATRGGTAMSGYWGQSEETARMLSEGWVHSGDLGVQDADGYVTLAGRKKHMIIRGGENVYPAEVEAILLQAPGVRDGVILGLPDDRWGETVIAVVTTTGSDRDGDAVIAHCRRHLASYKCPERVIFHDALPYNAAGKILRHVLLAELLAVGRAQPG